MAWKNAVRVLSGSHPIHVSEVRRPFGEFWKVARVGIISLLLVAEDVAVQLQVPPSNICVRDIFIQVGADVGVVEGAGEGKVVEVARDKGEAEEGAAGKVCEDLEGEFW